LQAGRFEPGITGEWSQLMLDRPEKMSPSIPLTLHRLDLAQQLSLLAVNAEMSVAYGLRLRERTDDVLPVGYSNGMIGYVTTAQQVIEGGYEPVDSSRYYALPAPFTTDAEAIVNAAIDNMVS
jgi:hypothetical protein